MNMTNGERIRSMTDEELAKLINKHHGCPSSITKAGKPCPTSDCVKCWLIWVKEVDHGDL